MEDYKPNSYRYKQQKAAEADRPKIEKVVKGTVKTRKKNEIQKLANIFIAEDVGSVGSYIFSEVVVPTIKKTIVDVVSMIFLGETSRGHAKSTRERVSYTDYSRQGERRSSDRGAERVNFNYDDLVFESRGEVEAVLDQMQNVIDQYGFVRVADLYDMVELTAPYTSNRYGWTNIRSAEPVRLMDGSGYVIKLPKAMPFER